MKRLMTIALMCCCLFGMAADEAGKDTADKDRLNKLDSDAQKLGYAIGMQMGMTFRMIGMTDTELNQAALQQGLADALNEGEMLMTPQEAEEVQRTFFAKLQAEQGGDPGQEGAPAPREDGAEAGAAYLKTNAAKEGVTVTDSGLQVEVLEKGEGPKPAATDTVKVHYTGTFIDGEVFDSSVERGQPAEFPLSAVIPAWTEGMQLMSIGSKYRLVAPSALAYGERGYGPIPPNAVLVFEVELLDIVDAKK